MNDYISKNCWPIGIIISFIIVAIFQYNLVRAAFDNRAISIVEDPYEEGLRYEEVIQAKRNALDVSSQITIDASSGEVDVKFIPSAASISNVSLSLKRPTTDRFDHDLALGQVENGFRSTSDRMVKGLWLYTLQFTLDGAPAVQTGEVIVD